MKVIKLGGSLSHSEALIRCMEIIDQERGLQRLVIVPGGGAFADQVRLAQQYWRFDQVAAHHMAILAMQQMALMFHAMKPNWVIKHSVVELKNNSSTETVIIWSPVIAELDQAGVPASWDITSDSLAAWLATQLQAAELVLVKSASIEALSSLKALQQQGVIDRGFHLFTEQADFAIRIQNQQQFSCIQ